MNSAGAILDLLRVRHSKDVFVSECKTGSTQDGHQRMDAWAMPCSWTQWTTYGYEIKVSRSDFIQDMKWRGYLEYCHNFYFVCPWGLIAPTEIPEEAGVIWATRTMGRLYTKKKAPQREVQIPDTLYAYILMSRTQILPPWMSRTDDDQVHIDQSRYWREWLAKRRDGQELGHGVSRRVAEIVAKAQTAQYLAEKRVEFYEIFREKLRALGFDPDAPTSEWQLDKILKERMELVPRELEWKLERTRQAIEQLEAKIREIKDVTR